LGSDFVFWDLGLVHLSISEQLFYRNEQWFRGGLVFKAGRLLYLSNQGLRVITKKRDCSVLDQVQPCRLGVLGFESLEFGVRAWVAGLRGEGSGFEI